MMMMMMAGRQAMAKQLIQANPMMKNQEFQGPKCVNTNRERK